LRFLCKRGSVCLVVPRANTAVDHGVALAQILHRHLVEGCDLLLNARLHPAPLWFVVGSDAGAEQPPHDSQNRVADIGDNVGRHLTYFASVTSS
jgi:hypothetical protein